MRKIEQRIVNAINNKVNYRESNTEVIVKGANVFVRLYDTYIYAKVRGKVYFSDGGFNTATTSSRLRALGADYSTNNKLCGCKLTSQKEMLNLRYYGKKDNIVKRLDNAKYLERFKQRVLNKADRYCISEHDAVFSIFRNTNILNK